LISRVDGARIENGQLNHQEFLAFQSRLHPDNASSIAQNDTFTLGATFPCVFFHLWSISVDLSPFSRLKTAFLLGFGTIYIKSENPYARISSCVAIVGHRGRAPGN
jgi:hypothetical protein